MNGNLSIVRGITLRPGWLESESASLLMDSLWKELEWRQDSITIMGRSVLQPRLTSWCSDPGVEYRYSGLRMVPQAWHPRLHELREQLQDRLGRPFNAVLVNVYRDGNDSMGWHADNEKELGPRPLIASISLGATRRFLVRRTRPRSKPRQSRGIDLEHGDLLIMEKESQSEWQHCLARTRKPVGLRLNLTYRYIRN